MKMKFKKVVLLFLLSLVCVVFVGCREKLGGFKTGNKINVDDIINVESVNNKEQNLDVTGKIGEVTFSSDEIYSDIFAGSGLLVIKNEYGYIGFYSLIFNKYIIEPQYVPEWTDYILRSDNYLKFFLEIKYEGSINIYDSIGNNVYSGDDSDYLNINLSTYYRNGKLLLNVTNNNNEFDKNLYIYDNEYKISLYKDYNENQEDNTKYPLGDKYTDCIELSDYGLKGYVGKYRNLYTIFDEEYNAKFSYELPENSKGYFIGNKLYYQVSYNLPDDTDEYDIFCEGEKYSIKSYSINLETGKEVEEELYCIIEDTWPYLDKDNNPYSIVLLSEINEFRTLESEKYYLFNKKGQIVSEINNIDLDSLVKIGENYYDKYTKILYDSELKEIAYLNSSSPVIIDNQYFLTNIDGKYGILDSNAKVVVEHKYDLIYDNIVNDYIICKKGETYYRVRLNSTYEEELSNGLQRVNLNLFKYYDNGYVKYETVDGMKYYEAYSYSSNLNEYNVCYGMTNDKGYIIISDKYDESYVTYTILYINKFENDITSIGNEKNEEIQYGESKKDSIDINVNEENKLHFKNSNTLYYNYTPSESAYYSISDCGLVDIDIHNEYNELIDCYYDYDLSAYTFIMFEDVKYYVVFSNKYYGEEYATFDFAKVTDSKYPLICVNNKELYIDNHSGITNISFYSDIDSMYKISLNNDCYIYYNDKYYYNDDLIYFKGKGNYEFSLYGEYSSEQNIVLKLSIDKTSVDYKGTSVYNPIKIENVDYSYSIDNEKYDMYYKFTNNDSYPVVVNFNINQNYGNDNIKYTIYDNSYSVMNNNTVSGSSNTTDSFIVPTNKSIYIEFDQNNLNSNAHFSIIKKSVSLDYYNSGTKSFNTTYIAYLENVSRGYGVLDWNISRYCKFKIFDADGKLVYNDSYTDSGSLTYNFSSYSYYVLIESSYSGNVSFNFDTIETLYNYDNQYISSGSSKLYYINLNDYKYYGYKSFTITFNSYNYSQDLYIYNKDFDIILNKNSISNYSYTDNISISDVLIIQIYNSRSYSNEILIEITFE